MLSMLARKILQQTNHITQRSSQFLYASISLCNSSRYASSTPVNTIIMFVPQQEVWIVERMGKFHRQLEPGLNFLLPVVDKVKYVQCLKEIVLDIPDRTAVTSDNVTVKVDGLIFLKVNDPYSASYNVDDPEHALTQLAHSTLRFEIGKLPLDEVLRQQEDFNNSVINSINETCRTWGITCLRYETKNIELPLEVKEAIKLKAEAEIKSKAWVTEAEGRKSADIRVAEGKQAAKLIESKTLQIEVTTQAEGEAAAIRTIANARAESIKILANVLNREGGSNAAALSVAEQYVAALNKMASTNNTLVVSQNASDVSLNIAQALTMYRRIENEVKETKA